MNQGSESPTRNKNSLTTGCRRLDAWGGVPASGLTLLCGARGAGKTYLALEFILRGAVQDQPGLFVSFRETEDRLLARAGELGFDLRRMISLDLVRLERCEPATSGVDRLEAAAEAVGAKRLVIDDLESLLSDGRDAEASRGAASEMILWALGRGLTTIVTHRYETGGGFGLVEESWLDALFLLEDGELSRLT